VFSDRGARWPSVTRGFTVDFMPYEGAPLQGGHELKRFTLVAAIAAVLLVGAWALASAPVSSARSSSEARTLAPSTTELTNAAVSDSDLGPGESEAELASHPVATR
jgi:hypothetical protein